MAAVSPAAIAIAVCGAGLHALAFASSDSAVIANSGSTNSAGFRVVVKRSGEAEYGEVPRASGGAARNKPVIRRQLPDALVRRFYSDLEAAGPLSALPVEHCPKSVSFGTRTTVESGGEETPDLSCPNPRNVHAQALMRDANEIVNIFRKH
jgi:hypothetical protein